MADADGFFARWAQRKAQVQGGAAEAPLPPPPAVVPPPPAPPETTAAPVPPAAPALTLDDVARLTPASDYAPFVGREVDASVRNAAMKKLFSDPHFNVMDGLDIYIDDYGRPDPIPDAMLRQMTQSHVLGLFDHEAEPAAAEPLAATTDGQAAPALSQSPAPLADAPTASEPSPDEDPDLRLQQDDGAGRPGADPRARP